MPPDLVVPLVDPTGRARGRFELWGDASDSAARETTEYRFHLHLDEGRPTAVEPAELLDADADVGWRSGRLRTQNHVGTIEVTVERDTGTPLRGEIEVTSRRLQYEDEYRWMLAGIATDGAALLLQRYAASSVTLGVDFGASAGTLYQQVAFLSAIVQRPHTIEAFERVLRSPYVSYVDVPLDARVERGLPGSARTVRQLGRPGPRTPGPAGFVAPSLPLRLAVDRTEPTIDNLPNRFVRAVVEEWSIVLARVRALLATDDSAPARRGLREIDRIDAVVDRWRSMPLVRSVGRLGRLSGSNQVLMRRNGYREIHQAFVESRAAALLRWDEAEVHRGGQRDAATLYEYWTYLELRRIVTGLCDHADSSPLVELSTDGLHLNLRRGLQQVVSGFLTRAGRSIDVELWFNRSFRAESATESWSLQMRPDCSLRLSAQSGDGERVDTWLHFDAKYRLQSPNDLFVGDDQLTTSRRGDLLKMHAYRDAIHRTSGAYVLYPGDTERRLREYREILPGLGAFPFRPASDGHAAPDTVDALHRFLDDVLDHLASQATNRERASYWEQVAHAPPQPAPSRFFVPLDRPPADTSVLVAFVRSPAHRRWIEANRLYNLRTGDRRGAVAIDGPAASATILVVWSDDETTIAAWHLLPHSRLLDADAMRDLGYPTEATGQYLCRELGEQLPLPDIPSVALRALVTARPVGMPIVTTWSAVVDAIELH